jgi:hypothetical protein
LLVEEVRVGAERHRRGVSGLAGDFDGGGALGDQQADGGVAQIVVAPGGLSLAHAVDLNPARDDRLEDHTVS